MRFMLILLILLVSIQPLISSPLPTEDKLFEALAINVPTRGVGQFIYGDNIQSYYEAFTHDYDHGNSYFGFSDFISFVDGKLQNKRKCPLTKIYPYGVKNIYKAGVADEFILFNKKLAFSLELTSKRKKKLSILPITYIYKAETKISQRGNILLLSSTKPKKDEPSFVAISANQPFTYRKVTYKKDRYIWDIVRLRGSIVKLLLTSKVKTTKLNLVFGYGFSEKEAYQNAKRLQAVNYSRKQKTVVYKFLTRSFFWSDDLEYNKVLSWAKLSSYFMVVNQFGKGIWAGLPWFRDNWGRDTFIALPGTLLVNGNFKEAKAVLNNFGRYQKKSIMKVELMLANDTIALKKKVRDWLQKNLPGRRLYGKKKITVYLGYEYVKNPRVLIDKLSQLGKLVPAPFSTSFKPVKDKDYGRVPNRVAKNSSIIYNTTDGTPWFIREAWEYLQYTGDRKFAKDVYPVIKRAMDGAILNYVDKQGFLTHAAADTWMDAKIGGKLPWSDRGTRANDIQVLWYNSLMNGAELAKLNGDASNQLKWQKLAAKLKTNFAKLFWNDKKKLMADRLRKDDSADLKVRPNQLMLLSVPLGNNFIPIKTGALVLKNAVEKLLLPYGIMSLEQDDDYFHPYHDGMKTYQKDAAYHNGTIWGWNAGFTITALLKYGFVDFGYRFAKNLSAQILYQGCLGSMSENIDAFPDENGLIKLSGTYSQAWSVSEFSRNGYQDFGGFQPRLMDGEIILSPAIPKVWNSYQAKFAFGKRGAFSVGFKRVGKRKLFKISYRGYKKSINLRFREVTKKGLYEVSYHITSGEKLELSLREDKNGILVVSANRSPLKGVALIMKSQKQLIGKLKFAQPKLKRKYKTLGQNEYLKKIVEGGKYR